VSSLLTGLNPQQQQAVTSTSPTILCLAGAGSGKTTVLTRRIANLNQEHRVGTSDMLALTFTRLAGKEMKERVMKLVGEEEGKKLFCNTFHAFAVSVLQEWGHVLGIDKQFTIYDQSDREAILEQIIQEFGSRTTIKKVLSRFAQTKDVHKERMEYPEECRVLEEYGYRLRKNNAVDLDRLIDLVTLLWQKSPDTLKYYQQMYTHVFVDEFQDTNDEQMQMIRLLNPQNLFIVGDDFQAIYGWRGARVQYILDFPSQYPGCEVVKLEDNYRSTHPIVAAANNLIAHNVYQTEKTLRAHKDGSEPRLIVVGDERMEPSILANCIQEAVHQHGRSYQDIAILTRTNSQIDRVKKHLEERNIPVVKVGGGDIFQKHDIKALIAWLEVILNQKDGMALQKAIQFPEPFLTVDERQQLELYAVAEDLSLLQAMHKYQDQYPGAQRFIRKAKGVFESWICYGVSEEQIPEMTASLQFEILTHVLELSTWYEQRGLRNRMDDIEQALQFIRVWERSRRDVGEDVSLSSFLRWLKHKDIQEKLVQEQDAVKLLTVHASKGLEFPVVMLAGMTQGCFPSRRTNDIEEERRLAYVAVTRAKEKLILTRAEKVFTWNNQLVDALPSQFLEEIKESKKI
jgi:DNA helicase-2/ATP-dependent DNA helicase PcrA